MHFANGACTFDIHPVCSNAFSQSNAELSLCTATSATVNPGITGDTTIVPSSPTVTNMCMSCKSTGYDSRIRTEGRPPPIPPKVIRDNPPLPPKSSRHMTAFEKRDFSEGVLISSGEIRFSTPTVCMSSCNLNPTSTTVFSPFTPQRSTFHGDFSTLKKELTPVLSNRYCPCNPSQELRTDFNDSTRPLRHRSSKAFRRLTTFKSPSPLSSSEVLTSPKWQTSGHTLSCIPNQSSVERFPICSCSCKVNLHWNSKPLQQSVIHNSPPRNLSCEIPHTGIPSHQPQMSCNNAPSTNIHASTSKSACGSLQWISQSISKIFKIRLHRRKSTDSNPSEMLITHNAVVPPDDKRCRLQTSPIPNFVRDENCGLLTGDLSPSIVSCGGALWRRRSSSCHRAKRSSLPSSDGLVTTTPYRSTSPISMANSCNKCIPLSTSPSTEFEASKQVSQCTQFCDSNSLKPLSGRTHPLPPSRANNPSRSRANTLGRFSFSPLLSSEQKLCPPCSRCHCTLLHSQSPKQPSSTSPGQTRCVDQTTMHQSPRLHCQPDIHSLPTTAVSEDRQVHHIHHIHHVHHVHHHHHHVHLQSDVIASVCDSDPHQSYHCSGHVCTQPPRLCCAVEPPTQAITRSASLDSIESHESVDPQCVADKFHLPICCTVHTVDRGSRASVTVSPAHTSHITLTPHCGHSWCPSAQGQTQNHAHCSSVTSNQLHPILESASGGAAESAIASSVQRISHTCSPNNMTLTTTTLSASACRSTNGIISSPLESIASEATDVISSRANVSVCHSPSTPGQSIRLVDWTNMQCDNTSDNRSSFHRSMLELRKMGWYWGPLSFKDAQILLAKRPDGTFLVRDSGHDMYILSLSFRVRGETYHTRIEHNQGRFSFWSQPQSHSGSTMVEFIEKAVARSISGQFHYFLQTSAQGRPPVEVPLLYPLSRFQVVPSLRHLSRFAILSSVRHDHIDQLPLPRALLSYLMEKQCFIESLEAFEEATRDRLPPQMELPPHTNVIASDSTSVNRHTTRSSPVSTIPSSSP